MGDGYHLSLHSSSQSASVCCCSEKGWTVEAAAAPTLNPAAVTASIAVTLTPLLLSLEHLWTCQSPGSRGGGGEAFRGKRVLKEICRVERRQWSCRHALMQRKRQSLHKENGGKIKNMGCKNVENSVEFSVVFKRLDIKTSCAYCTFQTYSYNMKFCTFTKQ